jgi:uncharacterized membrane protein
MVAWGARVFGLGIIALGLVCLAFGDFDFGQSVPKDFPARLPLAYAAAVFMMLAGAAIQWPRTLQKGAAALAIYFGLVVVIVMDGRIIVAHYAEYGTYNGIAAQVAVAAAALIIYAGTLRDSTRGEQLVRAGQITFGICALLFGGAHFVFMNLTAPLVPKWLPPSPEFWGYATGIFHIAGGLAVLTRIQARLAAVLLTVMYASFTPLVHLPLAMAHPENHFVWSENALNVILAGVAWVVAESFSLRRLSSVSQAQR